MTEKRRKEVEEKLAKLDGKSQKDFMKIIRLITEPVEEPKVEESSIAFASVSEETQNLVLEAVEPPLLSSRFNEFIRDMSLVYLIAGFESFLQKVLEISFQRKPEILSSSQKSITFEELVKFNNINDARQQIVEKEILSIINQDIENINRYFEQKFNVKFSQFTKWKKFKERFYRRNILIHNSGRTNRLYRLKTGYEGEDKRMGVSQSYLKESIELFHDMGSRISEHFHNKFK